MIYEGHTLRHELKYYINYGTYLILRERLKEFVMPDRNMRNEDGYLISSLYFDDIFETAMEEKLAGNRFRKKFRIRVYERQDCVIKLECKMKYDSYIYKESASLTKEEYDRILKGEYDFLRCKKEDVAKQLALLHRVSLLSPVTVVEYQREAYVDRCGNVRITFDKGIAASFDELDMLGGDCAVTEVLPKGMMVLEVKYDDYLPEYIRQLLQVGETEKCAISKYVMCRERNRDIRHF